MIEETAKGGRGECPFCHEWHNNVSYHSAWECKKNPDCALPSPGVSTRDTGNPVTRPAGLDFKCNSCGRQLTEPGAILFSPPKETAGGETIMCNKYHLCQECFELICDVTNLKY
jgi:hypothetical protein